MPSMWEAEMWRNGHEWMTEKDAQKDWQSLTVSDFVSHPIIVIPHWVSNALTPYRTSRPSYLEISLYPRI